MSYAANTDVVLEFKGLVLGTNLLAATVDEWCTQASAVIDSYVGAKYTVPVSTPAAALSILKSICITLVKARVADFLKIKSKTEETSQNEGADPVKAAMKMLEDIRDGKTILTGAALIGSADGVSSYVSSNLDTTTPPKFTRNDDNW